MKRRGFLTLLGGAAATWPFAVRAQQPALPVIGFLNSESTDLSAEGLRAFRQGLSESGFHEGQNLTIEYRHVEGQYERLPALAADLVRRQVSVIVAHGNIPVAMAAKAATTTIPIVFRIGTDPVEAGLVASLNRPGGNLTGVTTLGVELGPKRLELLRQLIPTAAIVALLVNPANPAVAAANARELQSAAATLGLQLHVLRASTEREIDTVFVNLAQLRADGLVIGGDAFFNARSEQLATLALRHAVPTIYQYREFAAAGGLMSYGGSIPEAYHQLGVYTGRILKGEKPADLPVQQITKVELIINLKTAKALGLTVPLALLTRADEVIE
jgi:putative ABC transport system substrate-binding protein